MDKIPNLKVDQKATGERMRNLCEKKNLNAADVQRYFGLDAPQAIYKWFRGETTPNIDNAVNYCRLVDVKIDDLLVIISEDKADEKAATGEANMSACEITEEISSGEMETANSADFEPATEECECSSAENAAITKHGATVGIDPVATGNRIKKLMSERDISVKHLQELFGFNHPQTIYAWRSGHSLPSLNRIVQLSSLLGTRISDILVTTDMCA